MKADFKLTILGISIACALVACGGGSEQTEATIDAPAALPADTSGAGSTSVPEVQFLNTPEDSSSPYALIAFESNQDTTFECKLDDGVYQQCESPYWVYPLTVGEHQFMVRAINEQQTSDAELVSWTTNSILAQTSSTGVHEELTATEVMPDAAEPNSWRGILRINCDFAHSSYDDPIVYPQQDDAAHLHRFYGNTLLDENSDTLSLFTSGDSSCQGNTLNRSAYWVPALLAPVYDDDQQPVYDDDGERSWQVVPAVVGGNEDAHEVFYYSAGIDDLEAIQTIPVGLKMIAGEHMTMPGMAQDTSIVRWHCQTWESDDATNPRWSSSIPECEAPDRVRMDIFFPSCWNGVDLDSDDHKSHMAYPVTADNGKKVCPASHPEPIIRVSFHYAFGVKPEVYHPEIRSSRGWRLAADMYEVSTQTPGGLSLHGDWFNAWHPEALQLVLDNCIKGALDCHDGNLANGYRLSGTRPGTQQEPPVVNKGMGY